MSHTPHEAAKSTRVSRGNLWSFVRLVLMIVTGFAAAVLVMLAAALAWPESTAWVLTGPSGWKDLAAAASFGVCLLLAAAVLVLRYIPFIGAAMAFMARASFLVFVVVLFVASLSALMVLGQPVGMGS